MYVLKLRYFTFSGWSFHWFYTFYITHYEDFEKICSIRNDYHQGWLKYFSSGCFTILISNISKMLGRRKSVFFSRQMEVPLMDATDLSFSLFWIVFRKWSQNSHPKKKIVIWGRLIMKNVFPFHFSFNDKDTYNNYLTLQKKNLSSMMTHENRNRILSAWHICWILLIT